MSPQKVLVTGGAGFIGANLTRLLLDEGYQVTVLDDFSTGQADYLDGLAVQVERGDILESERVEKLVGSAQHVVHLAAQTGVVGSLEDPKRDCRVNVVGTLNLLEACRKAERDGRRRRFVFASSNAPLGRQKVPAREDKAPLPISPYGAAKLAGEAYCLAYHGSWGLPAVALRFGNVYGPFSAHKNSVVAKFFKDLHFQGTLSIEGDGEQTRDFLHVGDLCRAVVCALRGDAAGEVFQIATGIETSIASLAAMMGELAGKTASIERAPARQGDIRKNYSCIDKARQVYGWKPQIGLEEGLKGTAGWFAEYFKSHGRRTPNRQAVPR